MRTAIRVGVGVLLGVALTGCGTWVNRQNPNANYQADNYDCQMQAARAYPPAYDVTTAPAVTNTNCYGYGNAANCTSTTTGGQPQQTGGDKNVYNRLSALLSCMSAKGWQMESQ